MESIIETTELVAVMAATLNLSLLLSWVVMSLILGSMKRQRE